MKEKVPNILFVGPLNKGSTSLQRLNALRGLGYNVRCIATWYAPSLYDPITIRDRIIAKLYRLGSPVRPRYRDWVGANAEILRAFSNQHWDVVWIEKGLTVDVDTINAIKSKCTQTRIVGYSPDDMIGRHNHSRQFLDGLPGYDAYFTTKSYNVKELKDIGCPAVFFVDNAFDPHTHRPVTVSVIEKQTLGGAVGFIGSYERARAESMRKLAQAGVPVRVYGANWTVGGRNRIAVLDIEGKTMIADDYAKVICAFDINLHFLRKLNRDQQTTRSIEIPACAKLMLAERTQEHLALFEDGVEAVFFDSNDELLDKARFYLNHPSVASKIGQAARARCLRSGYSNHHRLQQMLEIVRRL
jgi:hypothetical protein